MVIISKQLLIRLLGHESQREHNGKQITVYKFSMNDGQRKVITCIRFSNFVSFYRKLSKTKEFTSLNLPYLSKKYLFQFGNNSKTIAHRMKFLREFMRMISNQSLPHSVYIILYDLFCCAEKNVGLVHDALTTPEDRQEELDEIEEIRWLGLLDNGMKESVIEDINETTTIARNINVYENVMMDSSNTYDYDGDELLDILKFHESNKIATASSAQRYLSSDRRKGAARIRSSENLMKAKKKIDKLCNANSYSHIPVDRSDGSTSDCSKDALNVVDTDPHIDQINVISKSDIENESVPKLGHLMCDFGTVPSESIYDDLENSEKILLKALMENVSNK